MANSVIDLETRGMRRAIANSSTGKQVINLSLFQFRKFIDLYMIILRIYV
jgi:hypothetical protein